MGWKLGLQDRLRLSQKMLQYSRLISAKIATAHAFNQQSYVTDADRRKDLNGMQTKVNDNVFKFQEIVIHFIADGK